MSAPDSPDDTFSEPTEQPFGPTVGAPITTQPGAPPISGSVTISMPSPIEGVPPGLEYLTTEDTIVIEQMFEMTEIVTGWESMNRYSLKNANGKRVFFAAEESDCCERQFCGPQRSFDVHIVDNFKREVMTIRRPFKCCGGLCCLASIDCCAHECSIESLSGYVIGTVVQRQTKFSFGFTIRDEYGDDVFEIEGPCQFAMLGCQEKKFRVKDLQGQEVGIISKKGGGILREVFRDADDIYVKFPMDLDVKMKGVLIGATFLIYFMAFEHQEIS